MCTCSNFREGRNILKGVTGMIVHLSSLSDIFIHIRPKESLPDESSHGPDTGMAEFVELFIGKLSKLRG